MSLMSQETLLVFRSAEQDEECCTKDEVLKHKQSLVPWLVGRVPRWYQVPPWRWLALRRFRLAASEFVRRYDKPGASRSGREDALEALLRLHWQVYR